MQPSCQVQKSPSSEFPIGLCAVCCDRVQEEAPGSGQGRTGHTGGGGATQGRAHREPVQMHLVSRTTVCHVLPLPGELLLSHQIEEQACF